MFSGYKPPNLPTDFGGVGLKASYCLLDTPCYQEMVNSHDRCQLVVSKKPSKLGLCETQLTPDHFGDNDVEGLCQMESWCSRLKSVDGSMFSFFLPIPCGMLISFGLQPSSGFP